MKIGTTTLLERNLEMKLFIACLLQKELKLTQKYKNIKLKSTWVNEGN